MTDATPPKAPVLVTGGHRGVGHELARLFAAEGHDLVLVGRDGERLVTATDAIEAEYGGIVMPMAVDLGTAGAAADLHERIVDRGLPIAGPVNAAGRRVAGPVAGNDVEAELGQVRANALAPVELIGRLLPGMLERGDGAILNVASLAAFYVSPGLTGYHASEAFLLRYTRGLAAELREDDVAVTALCPETTAAVEGAGTAVERDGADSTAGSDESGATSGTDASTPAERDAETTTEGEGTASGSNRKPRDSAREVAAEGFRGLERGRTVVVPGVRARAMVTMLRVLPAPVVRRWAGWTGRHRGDG